jgi:hypothetical protein
MSRLTELFSLLSPRFDSVLSLNRIFVAELNNFIILRAQHALPGIGSQVVLFKQNQTNTSETTQGKRMKKA